MSTQEIMRLVSDYVSEYPNDTCGAKERAALESAIESLTAERDALKDAARLALDALENSHDIGASKTDRAIAALKAVL